MPGPARTHRLAVVPGDGVGVETTREAVKVLEALRAEGSLDLHLEELPWSADHTLATGETLPAGALERLSRDFDAILAGAFGDPRIPDSSHARDILLGMRTGLDLYANVRPVTCLDERLNPLKGCSASEIDLVVVRENTEGAYLGLGGVFRRGGEEIALEEDLTTRSGVTRVCRLAFAIALQHAKPLRLGRRPRVLMADKHNAQRFGGELWRRVFFEVAAENPDCDASHQFADALAARMVLDPAPLDVVVTNNLLGDVLSDLGAALQGGARDGSVGEPPPRPDLPLRAGPRLGARPRRAGPGQPVRLDPDRGAPARLPRGEGRGRAGRARRRGVRLRGRGDPRRGRGARDARRG